MKTEVPSKIKDTEYNETEQFRNEVSVGLSLPEKELPFKYAYNKTGSELLQKISASNNLIFCQQEAAILENYKDHLSLILEDEAVNLIELGPSGGTNSQIIIKELLKENIPFSYSLIDISQSHLELTTQALNKNFPALSVKNIHDENISGLKYVENFNKQRNLILLLSSQIGEMTSLHISAFLKQLRRKLNPNDYFLIGFDLRKDIQQELAFYNEENGLMSQLQLNLLTRINLELGGQFQLKQFKTHSSYNEDMQSINSYLISTQHQVVDITGLEQSFTFKKDEPIYIGSNLKFREQQIITFAENNGFEIVKMFSDDNEHFINSLWVINQ